MKKERLLLAAILLSMIIWGLTWSSAKVLSGYGSPASIALIRFAITTITLAISLPIIGISLKVKKIGIPYLLLGGTFLTFYTLAFFRGLQLGLPGAGGVLLTTTNPIFAYMIGLTLSGTKPSKKEIIGLITGVLAGIFLLKVWTISSAILASGNIFFLVAALLWASVSKIGANSNRYGNAMSFSFWCHVITTGVLLFTADLREVSTILSNGDNSFWGNMLYFGMVNSAFATTTYFFAASRIGAERASTFLFLVPAAAVIGAWLFLDEQLQWNIAIGGVLGIVAVYIINSSRIKTNT